MKSASSSSLFSICLHSGHFYHKPCNQGTQGRCVRSKKQHTSPDLYAFIHEGSISTTLCSNCKHFLNFACHAHKRIATEVVKIQPKKPKPFYRGTLKKVFLPGPGHYLWRTDPHFCTTPKLHRSPSRSVVWSPDHTLSQGETVW